MDTLKNKTYGTFDYLTRYAGVPNYYYTLDERDYVGIGTPMSKDTPWVAHKVKLEDTLDSLALEYYNNPTYWWVIAEFNTIEDPFIALYGTYQTLKIPSINSIEFGAERK